MRPNRLARLDELRTAQGTGLPERLKGEIRRQLQRLELVLAMIRALEAERDAIVTDAAPAQLNADKIR